MARAVVQVVRLDVGALAVWGALTLHLDFVNLFLFLLRLSGRRQ